MSGINVSVLRIKNFLSIADAEIHLGQVNQVVGNNNQGKTTVLKALEFAFAGSTDGTMVRHGEDRAEVIIELPDEAMRIQRKLSPEGAQSLDVKRGEFKVSRPQGVLDGLFSEASFNPVDLLDPKKRTDAILNSMPISIAPEELAEYLGVPVSALPPLDYKQHGLRVLEAAHKFYFQRRAEANRDTKEKLSKYEAFKSELPLIPEAATLSRADKFAEIELESKVLGRVKEQIAQVDLRIENARRAEAKVARYEGEIEFLDKEIAELEQKIQVLKKQREMGERLLADARAEVPRALPDRSALLAEAAESENRIAGHRQVIAEIEHAQSIKRQHEMVAGYHAEATRAEEYAKGLDETVKALAGGIKKKIMSQVEMPVPGLEYVDGGFQIDGVPIDHLSTSKAMRLAIGVARKLSGPTKIICLDGAEALDQETYTALRAEIEGDGYTYIITKVGEPFVAANDKVFRAKSGVVSEVKPA
ncbi:MAG: AAA family ATPase [Bdellovibrionaceae bacterium]|nr:AAA family ATPase [Pseudobdellovibrionaceae bacterium]